MTSIKKFVPYIAGAVIAVASVFAVGVSFDDAIQIALNTDKAKAACEQLLTEQK